MEQVIARLSIPKKEQKKKRRMKEKKKHYLHLKRAEKINISYKYLAAIMKNSD